MKQGQYANGRRESGNWNGQWFGRQHNKYREVRSLKGNGPTIVTACPNPLYLSRGQAGRQSLQLN